MSSGNGASALLDRSIAAVRDAMAAAAARGLRSLPRGGGTKDALSTPAEGVAGLEVAAAAGIVEYAPSEFTVTALAGTRVAELAATLAAHGQYLPFDPPLAAAGATLGGTIASGLSGPGRVRYGGVRDFVLGVRLLDGEGTLVRGGGKVVKNAAGFDLPKLMVGSLGSLGVIVEATLKVFPSAEATATGVVDVASVEEAVAAIRRLLRGPSEVDALDLEPPPSPYDGPVNGGGDEAPSRAWRLWIRIAGRERVVAPRLERALGIAGRDGVVLPGDRADVHWRAMRELTWVPAGCAVVKVPLQPGRIAELESALVRAAAVARGTDGGTVPRTVYTAAGQQALVAWPSALAELDRMLEGLGLSGLVLRGVAGADRRRLGRRAAEAAIERARQALDPNGRFRAP